MDDGWGEKERNNEAPRSPSVAGLAGRSTVYSQAAESLHYTASNAIGVVLYTLDAVGVCLETYTITPSQFSVSSFLARPRPRSSYVKKAKVTGRTDCL